jgi:hypothetical protein
LTVWVWVYSMCCSTPLPLTRSHPACTHDPDRPTDMQPNSAVYADKIKHLFFLREDRLVAALRRSSCCSRDTSPAAAGRARCTPLVSSSSTLEALGNNVICVDLYHNEHEDSQYLLLTFGKHKGQGVCRGCVGCTGWVWMYTTWNTVQHLLNHSK